MTISTYNLLAHNRAAVGACRLFGVDLDHYDPSSVLNGLKRPAVDPQKTINMAFFLIPQPVDNYHHFGDNYHYFGDNILMGWTVVVQWVRQVVQWVGRFRVLYKVLKVILK